MARLHTPFPYLEDAITPADFFRFLSIRFPRTGGRAVYIEK